MTANDAQDTFYLIPHTHWEGAVFQTREAYLDMGLPNILRALALLEEYPDYRFTLDQVCYLKPFLERYPEQSDTLRRVVQEGRLGIVGGTDTMLDVNMPGGESFVRQVLYGKRYLREALGVDVTVGWQLDTFGHHAQMPQLLKLAGLRSFWFFRGVPGWKAPPEFQWEGLDGTRIPAVWLPLGYAVSYGSTPTLPEFSRFMEGQYKELGRFYSTPRRPGPGGADVCAPEEHLPEMVAAHNGSGDSPLRLQFATPAEYEAAVDLGQQAPVWAGELNPIFQGIYSSRIELKQQTRHLESLLTTVEKLGVLLQAAGIATDDRNLWEAWERVLFNEAHDLMSGVMTDIVYEDTRHSFDFARRLGEEELSSRLRAYGTTLDTAGEGLPLVVLNPLGSARTDLAVATIGFATREVKALKVLGPDGQPVPTQIMREERYAGGALVEAEIAFVAREVPALGHCIYHVLPAQPDDPEIAVAGEPLRSGLLESDLYRVQVDPLSGAVVQLEAKATGREVLAGPGNVVVQEADHGDLWELYRPLDGGSRIAMTAEHPLPPRGEAVYSDEQTQEPGHGFAGPVVSEFTVAHDFGERGQFATRVRLVAGLRRVEFQTRLVNQDEFVRYRVAFPTALTAGESTHEIPFGALARPDGIEYPAQNWVDYSDGDHGLALLNRGLPGNAVSGDALLLSLLRSTRIVAYGFGGGYGPGMSSDTGLELGQERVFGYALVPHQGDWRAADLTREGQEFNAPLLAFTAAPHRGGLPPRWGLLEITPANVTLTTAKRSDEDSAVVRVYESAGRATAGVCVRLPAGTAWVREVDLLEDPLGDLVIREGVVEFDLRPFEIKTLQFG